jgi:hypothetical protein
VLVCRPSSFLIFPSETMPMPMNSKERELLRRIHGGNPSAVESFKERYRLYIYKEVRSLIQLGLIPQEQKDAEWQNIVDDFVAYIRALDEPPLAFTIKQLIHFLVVYRAFALYLSHPPTIIHHVTPRIRVQLSEDDYRDIERWDSNGWLVQHSSRMLLPSTGFSLLVPAPTKLQFLYIDGESRLTTSYLSSILMPYINALAAMQEVCDEILNRDEKEVIVRNISYNSPIGISLEGAGDAIEAVKEDVIPWRRENAKKLAELQARKVEAEIKKNEAEAAEIRARSTKERAEAERIRAEAAKLKEEARKMKLENEKLELELTDKKLQLAFSIVAKLRPDIPGDQRFAYAVKMLPQINALVTSEIEDPLLLP